MNEDLVDTYWMRGGARSCDDEYYTAGDEGCGKVVGETWPQLGLLRMLPQRRKERKEDGAQLEGLISADAG